MFRLSSTDKALLENRITQSKTKTDEVTTEHLRLYVRINKVMKRTQPGNTTVQDKKVQIQNISPPPSPSPCHIFINSFPFIVDYSLCGNPDICAITIKSSWTKHMLYHDLYKDHRVMIELYRLWGRCRRMRLKSTSKGTNAPMIATK